MTRNAKLIAVGAGLAALVAGLFLVKKVSKGQVAQGDGFVIDFGSLFGVAFDLGPIMPGDFEKSISSGAGAAYIDVLDSINDQYGFPARLLARVAYQESRFRSDIISGAKRSSAGAIGMFQFMPGTVTAVSKNLMKRQTDFNPANWRESAAAAAVYLAYLFKRFGDWKKALAAYNWGEGNVKKKGLAAAPVETRNYYAQIMGDLAGGVEYA